MHVIHALEPLRKGIFLAGPTPRDDVTPSWRPGALDILSRLGFDGEVYVPEGADWASQRHYDAQILWEWEALHAATVTVFWVPRDLQLFPAYTTNVEFGLLAASSKAMLGFPPGAPKMAYLVALADRYHVPVFDTLEGMLEAAVVRTSTPFGTSGGAALA